MNANSNEKNLDLFFEDAKFLFKKMKYKRKQKLIEINNSYRYRDLSSNINNRCVNSYNSNNINPLTNNLNINKSINENRQINRIQNYNCPSPTLHSNNLLIIYSLFF